MFKKDRWIKLFENNEERATILAVEHLKKLNFPSAPTIFIANQMIHYKRYLAANECVSEAIKRHGSLNMLRMIKARLYLLTNENDSALKMINSLANSKINPDNLHFLRNHVERRLKRKPYDQDGLFTIHDSTYKDDERFKKAYERGIRAAEKDYNFHWRVHVGLWVASQAIKLKGDFIECGVNRGFMSSAIMDYVDWAKQKKTFYLLDTFYGMEEKYISEEEIAEGILERNQKNIDRGFYTQDVQKVEENFAEWPRTKIIPGPVPDTLDQVKSKKIAFLHLDMNNSIPEIAALEYFWKSMTKGGLILLDDYAYSGFHHQKRAFDLCGQKLGFDILSLPTGQGLIIK